MSASCEWSLVMTGRNRNKYLNEILAALYLIEDVDPEQGKKIFDVIDSKNFSTKRVETYIFTSNLHAKHIFGENYLEPEIELYIRIAKAAPNAVWSVSSSCISENGGEGCESYVEVTYKEGKIQFKTDTYVDMVTLESLVERMNSDDNSYESFCKHYTVDDTMDEDTYGEYQYDEVFYNPKNNTVSREHIWNILEYSIEY